MAESLVVVTQFKNQPFAQFAAINRRPKIKSQTLLPYRGVELADALSIAEWIDT